MNNKLLGRTLAFGAVLGLGLYAIPAVAKHHGGKYKEKMFEKLDKNDDGVVSKVEFLASAEDRFSKMDANGDGNLNKEEAENYYKAMREKRKLKKEKREDKD